jgi:nephrocystin-3
VERDLLVKRMFPRLRLIARSRGISLVEIDLRWEVTDEEKAEGKVLPICLDEIEHCRPFFIGILGERYGWVLGSVPAHVLEREPWLAEAAGRSVTELEITKGVLNNPELARRPFFYLRDPGYLACLPENERHSYIEADPASREKLASLKARIPASGFPVRDGYASMEAFAELVERELS